MDWWHTFELLAKGFHGDPQIIHAVAKTIDCSQQIDSKAPLLKTTPTQIHEHGKAELDPT